MKFLEKLSSEHLFFVIIYIVAMVSFCFTAVATDNDLRKQNCKLKKTILKRDSTIIHLIDLKTKSTL